MSFAARVKDAKPRVILRHCDSYDSELIRGIVRDGLDELGLKPTGRTLVKPNAVLAGEVFKHAHTRAEFLEGVLLALKDRAKEPLPAFELGERCGITVPTRYTFREANYLPMLERVGALPCYFDETSQVKIALSHERRLRDHIYVPKPVARADFFVNCPKFKAHPWTTVTFSMKNYIGIQDDRHRLLDHDYALSRKVCDLQHVLQPQLVCIDAIVAGEGRMLTPIPKRLNLVVLGNNQVAVDSVCCNIIGIDPRDVDHIRFAHEDGFGPMDLSRIEVGGDVSLGEAQERAQGFQVGLVRVEKYFEGTHISAYAGPPPSHDPHGYCWGGCPGALEEAVEIARLYDRNFDDKMPKVHLVFGDYRGPLDVSYGEPVVFIGDCAQFSGHVEEQMVSIQSLYRDRSTLVPEQAEQRDIYAKMISTLSAVMRGKRQPYMRLVGCPVSVADLVLLLATLSGSKNPYLIPDQAVRFSFDYLAWRAKTLWARLSGQPYLLTEEIQRGRAQPSTWSE